MALITRPVSINNEEYSQMVIEDGKAIMIAMHMRECVFELTVSKIITTDDTTQIWGIEPHRETAALSVRAYLDNVGPPSKGHDATTAEHYGAARYMD